MNYVFFSFLFFFLNCSKKDFKQVDFCQLTDSISVILKKEKPNFEKLLVYDNIKRINDKVIVKYLNENSKKFSKYNFDNYFNNTNSKINYNLKCQTINSKAFDIFKEVTKNDFWKNYCSLYGNNDFIVYYEPIFSTDKSEFILYHDIYICNLGSYTTLAVYENINEKSRLKKILITSTFSK